MALDYGAGTGFTVRMEGPFGSVGSSGKITQITLPAENWKNGESPFFQTVEVAGISEAKADNGGRPRLSDDGQLDAGGGSGCYGRENGRV